MKPGATTRPPASMVLFAVPEIFPTSAIFPCAIPMLACFAAAPVPSTTMPFLIRMSRAMRHDTRKKTGPFGPFRDCLLHWLARAARAGARIRDEFLQGPDRQARGHDQRHRHAREQAHGREVAEVV